MMQCFWIGYWLLAIEVCLFVFPFENSSLYMYAKIVCDCFCFSFVFLLFFCKMGRKIFFKISLLCFIAAIYNFLLLYVCHELPFLQFLRLLLRFLVCFHLSYLLLTVCILFCLMSLFFTKYAHLCLNYCLSTHMFF